MALRTSSAVPEWEACNRQSYDTASKGTSALTAALVRNVRAELAASLNLHSAAVFNDYHKFFDTMDIEILIREAIANDFPLAELLLALLQHLSPRIIQVSGVSSPPTSVYRRILAGCKFSKAFTAVYLQSSMRELESDFKEASLGVFMDDTSMQCISNSKKHVYSIIIPCLRKFNKRLTRRRI